MPFDAEELPQLVEYVRTHFGEEQLNAADRRAMASLTVADLALEATEEGDDVIASPSGGLYHLRAYHAALWRELRRMVQPQ